VKNVKQINYGGSEDNVRIYNRIFYGAVFSLFLYACIIVSKKADKVIEDEIKK